MGNAIIERYLATRHATETLASPLSAEDQQVQAFADASPTKWHRGHTTWFFETFVLGAHGRPPFEPRFGQIFNSYYETLGPRHPRPQRGQLSRPSAEAVGEWRRIVDGRMVELMSDLDDGAWTKVAPLVELGIAHEEQHQELLLTDIRAAFAQSPLLPAYRPTAPPETTAPLRDMQWLEPAPGVVTLGACADQPFAFDNEGPRHRVFLEPYAISDRLVTVAELRAFIDAGGYRTPTLWLSEGWAWVQTENVTMPEHTRLHDAALVGFTLHGEKQLSDAAPASHLSYFEADALARFLGARLPTEAEWEHAARDAPVAGTFRDTADDALVPRPAAKGPGARQFFGDCWEWTSSAYAPYPGYQPTEGALGEYNGKFMVSQQVLRGGSVLSNRAHLRSTYRNFWPPTTRFQMTGLRLARTLSSRCP